MEGRGRKGSGKEHKGKYVGTQWLKEGEKDVPGNEGEGAERRLERDDKLPQFYMLAKAQP